MLYITVILALCIPLSFWLGYKLRDLTNKVQDLQEVIKEKIDKPKEVEEPKSEVIDPLDEVQTAIYEHNKMMERLNPDE